MTLKKILYSRENHCLKKKKKKETKESGLLDTLDTDSGWMTQYVLLQYVKVNQKTTILIRVPECMLCFQICFASKSQLLYQIQSKHIYF